MEILLAVWVIGASVAVILMRLDGALDSALVPVAAMWPLCLAYVLILLAVVVALASFDWLTHKAESTA